MGTSQSHNLKSSPNWSAAKRAMTSLANGTDNKSESNAKFFGNLGIALGNGLYVSIRPRACFSPSYNKVKSQTKHVWLLTLL